MEEENCVALDDPWVSLFPPDVWFFFQGDWLRGVRNTVNYRILWQFGGRPRLSKLEWKNMSLNGGSILFVSLSLPLSLAIGRKVPSRIRSWYRCRIEWENLDYHLRRLWDFRSYKSSSHFSGIDVRISLFLVSLLRYPTETPPTTTNEKPRCQKINHFECRKASQHNPTFPSLYHLISPPLVLKYSSLLLLPYSLITSYLEEHYPLLSNPTTPSSHPRRTTQEGKKRNRLWFVNSRNNFGRAKLSFERHESQTIWFRSIFMKFSRLMWVAEIVEVIWRGFVG